LLRSLAKSQARIQLGDQQLVLSGEASSAEIRDEIIAAAKRFAPDTYRIADRLTISAVAGSPTTEGGGTVPSNAASNNGAAAIENFDTFTIYYDSGAYGLRDSEIDTFVKIIEAAHKSKAPIQIEGFADRKGVATVNDFVSRMRTEMLKKYLVERGIDGGRISSTIWHGAVEGEEEDQQNRRTEIKVGK
jgi:outer membrane protein OmpA-like peptidoglycan-associated protein